MGSRAEPRKQNDFGEYGHESFIDFLKFTFSLYYEFKNDFISVCLTPLNNIMSLKTNSFQYRPTSMIEQCH